MRSRSIAVTSIVNKKGKRLYSYYYMLLWVGFQTRRPGSHLTSRSMPDSLSAARHALISAVVTLYLYSLAPADVGQ